MIKIEAKQVVQGAEDLATRRMCKKPAEALSDAARGENNSKIK